MGCTKKDSGHADMLKSIVMPCPTDVPFSFIFMFQKWRRYRGFLFYNRRMSMRLQANRRGIYE